MKIDTFSGTVPQMVVESQNQRVQGLGVEGVSWTSSMGDHLHLHLSYCCCHCRFLFCASLFSFSPLPLSLAHVACGVPLPLPFSGAPPVLACVPHLVSSIYWWCRVHCHCRKKQTSLLQYVLQDSQCSTVRKESPETLHLSLSDDEDDEGARLTGAGFGFRTRGFGAGFSAGGKNKHWAH